MPKTGPTPSILNATVVKLGLVSLFADIASEMLYPITPIFLTTVLGASMTSLGLIEGFAEAVASLLKASSGVWSDRITRRKPFIFGGYFLSAVAKPLVGLSTSWGGVLGARALDRVGKGIRGGPRDALLAESVPPGKTGAAFGWHRAMDTLGAAIGPLLAIAFLKWSPGDGNLRMIYLWAIIPGTLSVLLALSVREKKREEQTPLPLRSEGSPLAGFSPEFWKYLLAWGVFSLTNSSDVFLLMRMKENGASLTTVILVYCFYNLFYAALSPSLGSLSDRIGRTKILISGLLVFAAVYAGFSRATEMHEYWILFAVYGIYMAATDGVGKSLIVDLVPRARKATGIGLLGTVTGLGAIVASGVTGAIWDRLGASSALLYGSAGAVFGALLLFTVRTDQREA